MVKKMGSEFVSQSLVTKDELGSGDFGCKHYRRRCKIRAPCCNEIFDCRHCHNEAKNSLKLIPFFGMIYPAIQFRGTRCTKELQNCGVCMGKYFCQKCKFFDDDVSTVSKQQYHCDECGICRTGGKENFFHCNKCGCCYSKLIKDSHHCVEMAMHHNCPVCFEFLFDTMKDITVLPCGHTIHLDCVKEMERHNRYSCPVCSKSICDLSNLWKKIDQEVASTPMPEMYKDKMVWILCNDCGVISEVHFHILAHKCLRCKSYNTRQIQASPPAAASSSSSSGNRVVEMVR